MKIAANTTQTTTNTKRVVRLHGTDIFAAFDGKFQLDTGGWKTVTTKKRMNDLLPTGWGVYQERKRWYIWTEAGTFNFIDKMVLCRTTGKPIGTEGVL